MNQTASCRIWCVLTCLPCCFAWCPDSKDRVPVKRATLRSDAAVRMKFLTLLKLDPTLFAKKVLVLCCVGVKHEESLHKFCLARA